MIPYSLAQEYCAGEHLLMSGTPTVYQHNSGTQLRGVTFGYSSPLQDTYYDSTHTTQNGSQQYGGQTFWQYLNFYEDLQTGVGGRVSWARAYNNTHGTPTVKSGGVVTDDRYDALYCTTHQSDLDPTLRCTGVYAHPDDHAWSEQVVTQLTALGSDSSAGTLHAATTTYGYYRLAYTGVWNGTTTWCEPDQYNQEQDCVGDNWLPSGDSDWQDYFHAEYHGFAQVWSTGPAGDLTVQYYDSTEGWYTPWSDPKNFEGGSLYQEEVYRGNSYSSSNLLRTIVTSYADNSNACRSTTPTYPACEVVVLSVKTVDYPSAPTPSSVQDSYSYDDYAVEYGLAAGYHNLTEEDISGSNLSTPYSRKWTYTPNDQTTSSPAWTYYTVDTVTHSELDASGHTWLCQNTTYDENAPAGTKLPAEGLPTTTTSYSTCANQSQSAIPTYAGYDLFGNHLVSVDGVGATNSALYTSSGCTPTSSPNISSLSWSQSHYTTCTSYDSYQAQPQSATNALG